MQSSTPPPQDRVVSEPSEEEEELGGLVTTPFPGTSTKQTLVSDQEADELPALASTYARGGKISNAALKAEDEFTIDIEFVASKGDKQRSGLAAFTSPGTSSSIGSSVAQRRQDERKAAGSSSAFPSSSGPSKKVSIAGNWDSAENASLNKYEGSNVLDDTDGVRDEAEFAAWKVRDAQRRRDLLL